MTNKLDGLEVNERESRESTPLIDETHIITRPYPLTEVLPAVWFSSFLAAVDSTIVANIMAIIAAEFEQEDLKSWIATSFLLTNAAFQPLYGKASDIVGRKYALLFGQFFFALGCVLCAFARSVPEFAIARAISGIGGGGMTAMSSIIVSDLVTLEERGLFQGYANINFAAGQMIGAPLGGWALATIGWRWAFGLQAPLLAICMILAYRNINIPPRQPFTKESFSKIDFGGSFTLILVISSFLLLLSTNLNRFILSLTLVISLASFIYIEKYVAIEQILPSGLFKGALGVLSILSLLVSLSIYSWFFGIPIYLQIIQDQTSEQSGRFLIVEVVSVSIGSVVAGYFIRRFGSNVKRASIFITVLALVILFGAFSLYNSVLKNTAPYDKHIGWKVTTITSLAFVGFGYGSVLVSILVAIIAIVGPEGQAAATGVNYLFRSIGTVVGTGTSLSAFEIGLKRRLVELLKDLPNGADIVEHLVHDANYIKSGEFSETLKFEILNAYRAAMVTSFIPAIGFTLLALVIATVLIVRLHS